MVEPVPFRAAISSVLPTSANLPSKHPMGDWIKHGIEYLHRFYLEHGRDGLHLDRRGLVQTEGGEIPLQARWETGEVDEGCRDVAAPDVDARGFPARLCLENDCPGIEGGLKCSLFWR